MIRDYAVRAAATGDGLRTGIVADYHNRRVGSRERQKAAGPLEEHRSPRAVSHPNREEHHTAWRGSDGRFFGRCRIGSNRCVRVRLPLRRTGRSYGNDASH